MYAKHKRFLSDTGLQLQTAVCVRVCFCVYTSGSQSHLEMFDLREKLPLTMQSRVELDLGQG